jgi:hypothetical protein
VASVAMAAGRGTSIGGERFCSMSSSSSIVLCRCVGGSALNPGGPSSTAFGSGAGRWAGSGGRTHAAGTTSATTTRSHPRRRCTITTTCTCTRLPCSSLAPWHPEPPHNAVEEEAENLDADDEEPVFVLTDEWEEFFAKSDAKRRLGN